MCPIAISANLPVRLCEYFSWVTALVIRSLEHLTQSHRLLSQTAWVSGATQRSDLNALWFTAEPALLDLQTGLEMSMLHHVAAFTTTLRDSAMRLA